jgi:CheY-like chemotaxis protein
MRKLLIADAGEEFCLALAEMLSSSYTIRMCQDGKQALELLESFCPEVMVLDLTIPGTDGITLLERAAAKGFRPTVLATTRFCNDYVQKSLELLPDGCKCYMFLKLQFLEGVARYNEIFRISPPKAVYVFKKRVLCAKNGDFDRMREGGGSAVAYAWFVWEKGYKEKTVLGWI